MRANDKTSISRDFSGFAEAAVHYRTILVTSKMVAVR
jgi:hypothetical protein